MPSSRFSQARRPPSQAASSRRQRLAAGAPGRPLKDAPSNYLYQPNHFSAADAKTIFEWLETLRPLWEMRYSTRRPPPAGRAQRPLLRPVYWLGNWQFACLGYYEPPHVKDRCVAAEPFPAVLARLAGSIEARVRSTFPARDVPMRWHLNTCLVNFYGDRQELDSKGQARWIDAARVGEHRDFEPGPVASLSLGERARFQFVRPGVSSGPVRTEWLEDRSLQVFAGARWKDQLLHRVQRVEDKRKLALPPVIDGFRSRRINFTFRYVPVEHIVPFAQLSPGAQDDVREYVTTLATAAPFWAEALRRASPTSGQRAT